MNYNYTNTELLTNYLDGELQGDELERLEARFKEDKDLQQEFDNLKISVEAIKAYGLQQKVLSIHGDIMKEFIQQPLSKTVISNNFIRYTLRIAATIIIIAGSMLLYQYITLSSTSLYRDNFYGYTLQQNRGIDNQPQLEQEYELAHYDAVLKLFRQKQTKTVQDYFIAGNAYLQHGISSEAIKCFENVQQLNTQKQTGLYKDDTEYYLAMSFLQNNEPAKALLLFQKIHYDKNHLYHTKVSGWFLKKLYWLHHKS